MSETTAEERAVACTPMEIVGETVCSSCTEDAWPCFKQRLIADVEQAEAQLGEAQQQLRYWWETQHSCPCGARAEALDTHPHVLACPTERASPEKHG